jgi:hypothetical protein
MILVLGSLNMHLVILVLGCLDPTPAKGSP